MFQTFPGVLEVNNKISRFTFIYYKDTDKQANYADKYPANIPSKCTANKSSTRKLLIYLLSVLQIYLLSVLQTNPPRVLQIHLLSVLKIFPLNVLQIYPLSVLKTCPMSVMQIYPLIVLQNYLRLYCKLQNVFWNNVLNFGTKRVLWKKVLEIKSLWK